MNRSIRKGPFMRAGFLKKIEEMNQNGGERVIKAWSRSSTVFPQMIGHTTVVHNERKHILVYVTEDMVGYKLGEFVLTKTFEDHIKNEKTSKGK